MLNDQQLDRLDEQLKEARAARDDGYATTINALRGLLKAAKCPDPNCDGEGTCCGIFPGYDGEPDLDCWQCQWCAERKALLGETE